MKKSLAVLGATGRVGSWFTKIALDRGYRIHAVMRDASNVNIESPDLFLFPGDARDPDLLKKAISGTQAIISTVGDRKLHEETYLSTEVTQSLISVLDESPNTRVIAVAGEGILQADENTLVMQAPGYPDFLMNVAKDHLKKWRILEASRVPWTLVCAPQIIPTFPTGKFITKINFRSGGMSITSGDISEFILNELENPSFIRARVSVANQ